MYGGHAPWVWLALLWEVSSKRVASEYGLVDVQAMRKRPKR